MELFGRRLDIQRVAASMDAVLHRLKRALLTREAAYVLALMLAALVVRLPLMTYHGYYSDLDTYVGWGDIVNDDFTNLYTTTTAAAVAAHGSTTTGPSAGTTTGGRAPGNGPGGNGRGGNGPGGNGPGGGPGNGGSGGGAGFSANFINYPPVTPYLFGAVVFIYDHVARAPVASLDRLVRQNGTGPLVAKLPLLLADLGSTLLLFWEARKRHSLRFALVVAASFAFSPALLYNGAIWGQTDGMVSLPVLAAVFSVLGEAYVLGGVSLALAILMKPQPAILLPLMLVYLWRWARREDLLKFCAAGLVTGLVFLLPVLFPHFQVLDLLRNMQNESYNNGLSLSSDAFNFWWLIGYAHQPISSKLLGIQAGYLGDALFAAVTLLCGVAIWRRRDPVVLCFALAVQLFGFFLFMGAQHERYLFLFIPLALASIIVAPRSQAPQLVALYLAGTALCFLNMFVGVGGGISGGGTPIPFLDAPALSLYLTVNFNALSELLAALHLVVFAWAVGVLLQFGAPVQRAPASSIPQPASEEALPGAG